MPKIIGLTGGIGSGKSTVADYFRKSGIPVYIADDQAKKIMDKPEVSKLVIETFGNEILTSGTIDRKKLAAVVFNDAEKLAQLNAIIHPAVKSDFQSWISNHQDAPFLIKEAAILFESGSDQDCHFVITVTAPVETRIKRVMDRDNASYEAVLNRIANQWTDEQRIAKSVFVISNVNISETEAEIKKILKKLRNF